MSSQEIPVAAGSLLLSKRQDILNNHVVQFPLTPNHQGTMEVPDEVLSSVGARNMNTSGYEASDLEGNGFHRENLQLKVDAVFRPGIHTPVFPNSV